MGYLGKRWAGRSLSLKHGRAISALLMNKSLLIWLPLSSCLLSSRETECLKLEALLLLPVTNFELRIYVFTPLLLLNWSDDAFSVPSIWHLDDLAGLAAKP